MSVMQLKAGVVLHGNKYINAILMAAQLVYTRHGQNLVVTSGDDGVHGPNSYHPKHRALDIRFWDILPEDRRKVGDEIRALLPPYYDVVMESDHFHVEADEQKELAASP